MNLLIKYLNNEADANDGKHNSIDSWIWWAWNANSGDTGGIVRFLFLLYSIVAGLSHLAAHVPH